MMHFQKRPDVGRNGYASKAAVHATALNALLQTNGSPDHEAINAYIQERGNQIWGDVKQTFMAAQDRKCGFCEVIITESTGDVEHYRPKNAVWSLKDPGAELEEMVNIRGRKFNKDFRSGYWWLAYSWDNYLVSCPTCNQKWKSALFPIAETRALAPVVGDEDRETPLLLDPFGEESPTDHLSFDEFGQVQAFENSPIGRATITTCGLDRESLRSSRFEKAVRAFRLLRRLLDTETDEETHTLLNDFHELGRAEYVHAGMIRTVFEQKTGMTWNDLQAAIGGT